MKNLIIAATLALSSIAAPVAAHAGGPNEFGGARSHHDRGANVQATYAPTYVQPQYAQPVYAPPVYVQPNGYDHRDDRGERGDRSDEARRDNGRFEGARGRDAGGWQFSHGREGWRR
jgi:hypothetical protein